jgi:nickel/cobalt exporter
MSARRRLAVGAALVATLLIPAVVAAHPLGNFTINHYAGLRIEPERIVLDVVIDEAEIPAFQHRQTLDLDADGSVSDEELEAGRAATCVDLAGDLDLAVDGAPRPLTLTAAGLSFPLGASGLSTLRLVCTYEAPLASPNDTAGPTRIAFTDRSWPDRLGWREIVVSGDGVAVSAVDGELRADSPSARLTAYPDDLISQPLADLAVTIDAVADATVEAPSLEIADAAPLAAGAGAGAGGNSPPDSGEPAGPSARPAAVASPMPTTAPVAAARPAVIPGGIGGEIPAIFAATDVTPFVLLLSLATAAVLGAGHALTPGHGKTLMAAYLVGTRGRPLHAVGLGLSVSVSHTVGILVLAAVVIGAADILPPDLVVRIAPLVAAVSILAIGGWMLAGEWRRRRAATVAEPHGHDHDHAQAHDHDHAHEHRADSGLEHSHGGRRHSHAPAPGTTITWRGLFALGLAGGLIPSTSALLILLGAIAAGRPGFGFVLVVAFGLGMAAVMAAIGLALVLARERLDRVPSDGGLGRLREAIPLAAAVLVFGFGIWLTVQAMAAAPVL